MAGGIYDSPGVVESYKVAYVEEMRANIDVEYPADVRIVAVLVFTQLRGNTVEVWKIPQANTCRKSWLPSPYELIRCVHTLVSSDNAVVLVFGVRGASSAGSVSTCGADLDGLVGHLKIALAGTQP